MIPDKRKSRETRRQKQKVQCQEETEGVETLTSKQEKGRQQTGNTSGERKRVSQEKNDMNKMLMMTLDQMRNYGGKLKQNHGGFEIWHAKYKNWHAKYKN